MTFGQRKKQGAREPGTAGHGAVVEMHPGACASPERHLRRWLDVERQGGVRVAAPEPSSYRAFGKVLVTTSFLNRSSLPEQRWDK